MLHEGAVLDADAFLMKGQEVPPYTRWRGNPAAETCDPLVALPTPASPAIPIARLALAGMIVVAVSAGVVLALAPRSSMPGPLAHLVPPGRGPGAVKHGSHGRVFDRASSACGDPTRISP